MPVFLIPIIVQLILNLPSLIQSAESIFAGSPASGPSKKELVMSGVKALLNVGSKIAGQSISDSQLQEVLGVVSTLTDTQVATMQPVLKGSLVVTGTIQPQKVIS